MIFRNCICAVFMDVVLSWSTTIFTNKILYLNNRSLKDSEKAEDAMTCLD